MAIVSSIGVFSVYYNYHITVNSKEGLLSPLYIREYYGHLVALELSLYVFVKHRYYFSLSLMKGRNHLFLKQWWGHLITTVKCIILFLVIKLMHGGYTFILIMPIGIPPIGVGHFNHFLN